MVTTARSGHWRRIAQLAVAAGSALGLAAALAAAALGYWTTPGSGAGTASAGTIAPPTITAATPGAGTVILTWSSVTPPGSGSVTYAVTRAGAPAGGTCPTASAPTTVLTCTDSGLTAGTYAYTVTAIWRTWSATSSPATQVTLASGALSKLSLAAATTTPTAGSADSLTITAVDAQGLTVASYSGSHTLTFSGATSIGSNNPTVTSGTGAVVNFGTGTAITFSAGVASVTGASNGVMRLYRAQSASITVNEGGNLTSAALLVTVGPSSMTSFSIPTPASQTAGSGFTVSITALDLYGNTASGYTGSKCVTLSGPGSSPGGTAPSYPAPGAGCSTGQSAVAFSSGVAGSVSVTLYKAEAPSLTVTDTGKTGATGSFTVGPGSMAAFTLTTPSPTAGIATTVSITAVDTYGNTVASYATSKCLVFSGPGSSPGGTAPAYPAQGTCSTGQSAVTFTAGVASSVTLTLYKAETTSLTANDAGKTGTTGSFTVNGGAIALFTIPTPSSQVAGTPFTVSITAKDAYGNLAGYTGPQCVAFSGPGSSPGGTAPAYPAKGSCGSGSAVTFSSGAAASVSVTLYKAESPSLTVTDVPTNKTGTTAAFTVAGGTMSKLFLTAATTTPTIATTDSLTVRAGDAYGNATASYTGSHTLTFAGASASCGYSPTVTSSSGTLVAFGGGTALSFSSGVATVSGANNGVMRLYCVGTASLTVSEGGSFTSPALSVTASLPAGIGAKVQYRNHAASDAYDMEIIPDLMVVNTGSASLDLSLVTVRYWFTGDGGSTSYRAWCSYTTTYLCAQLSMSVTMLGQARTGADAYYELGFTSSWGSLSAAANSGEIMTYFDKNPYSAFNETNDYSWAAPNGVYTDWSKVTAYYYGNLVWGTEP